MLDLFKNIFFSFVPEHRKWELKNKLSIPSIEGSLIRLKKNGFSPQSIVDIGAYEGEWTLMVKKIYPSARVCMLEAQSSKREALEKVAKYHHPSVVFQLGMIGPENKDEVVFFENETVSSAFPEHYETGSKKTFQQMKTLDTLIRENNFPLPQMLKLDVQGFELEVLKGAGHTMQNVEVILMEVSLIDINKGAPLLHEVTAFLADNDFLAYDICSFIRRPLDQALWQTDLLFVKRHSQLISSKKYR